MNVYHAKVTSNALALSKNTGTPFVEIQVRTTHDVHTGEVHETTLTGSLWLTDKTAENTIKTLDYVFGWAGNSMQELNAPVLVGTECEIVVEDEEYNGRTTRKIQFFNRPGEGGARQVKPLEESAARSVSSRFDAALRAFKAKNGGSSQRQPVKAQDGPDSQHPTPPDDLPY